MAFDILGYYKDNKDSYGDAPLEDVAKDAFYRGGYDKRYSDYDTWKKSSGIDTAIQEDTRRRNPSFTDKLREAAVEPSSIFRRAVADPLVSLAKGAAVGIPESVVGLADIPTLGYAGKGADTLLKATIGKGFKEGNEFFDSLLSPETREAKAKVEEAKGFLPTVGTALQNPSSIIAAIAESAPSMFGGAGLGRGAMKLMGKGVAEKGIPEAVRIGRAITAGAVGEGLVTAGQNTEQIRQESEEGTLTPAQVALMAGSGAITGLISRMSGGLAKRLGITDVDTLLQNIDTGADRKGVVNILKGIIGSAISEGALEELPQSAQEQMAQNVALGKPAMDGVAEAGAMGLLAGAGMGIMGAGAGTIRRKPDTHDSLLKKLQDGAYYTDAIDKGIKSGTFQDKPFTPEVAIGLIQHAQKEGIYTDEDIDRFKERYPALRDDLNGVVVENLKEQINQELMSAEPFADSSNPTVNSDFPRPDSISELRKDMAAVKREEDVPDFIPEDTSVIDAVSKLEDSFQNDMPVIDAEKEVQDVPLQTETAIKLPPPIPGNVFSRMPEEPLNKMAEEKVKGALDEVQRRKTWATGGVSSPALETSPAEAANVSPEKIVEPAATSQAKFGQIIETAKGNGKVVGVLSGKDKPIPIIELEDGKRVRLDNLQEFKPEDENVQSNEEEKPDDLPGLLSKYEDTGEIGSTQELVEKLKEADNLSDPLKIAIMDYGKAVETDRAEYGMRSGLPEQAGDKVLSALKAEINKAVPASTLPAPLEEAKSGESLKTAEVSAVQLKDFVKDQRLTIDQLRKRKQEQANQPEAGQATGEQPGMVNLGQKGEDVVSSKPAPEPKEIFIRKAERKDLGRAQKSLKAIPEKQGYEKVYKRDGKQGRGFYYLKLKEKMIRVDQKPKKERESNNLVTFLTNKGKVRLGEFSSKTGDTWSRAHGHRAKDQSRELGVIAQVASKNGKMAMDEAADFANAEGFKDRKGEPFTADTLFEELAYGDARNVLHPEKSESIINKKIDKEEWNDAEERAAEQLARELEAAKIDAGAIADSQADIIAGASETLGAEGLTQEVIDANAEEIADFFASAASVNSGATQDTLSEVSRAEGIPEADARSLEEEYLKHATVKENIVSIEINGLDPKYSQNYIVANDTKKRVYLADNDNFALGFGDVILRVKRSSLDPAALQEIERNGGIEYQYFNKIPPELIERLNDAGEWVPMAVAKPSESDTIPNVTTQKGTANIPAKTTPQAEAEFISPSFRKYGEFDKEGNITLYHSSPEPWSGNFDFDRVGKRATTQGWGAYFSVGRKDALRFGKNVKKIKLSADELGAFLDGKTKLSGQSEHVKEAINPIIRAIENISDSDISHNAAGYIKNNSGSLRNDQTLQKIKELTYNPKELLSYLETINPESKRDSIKKSILGDPDMTGDDLYNHLVAKHWGNEKKASEELRDRNIAGLLTGKPDWHTVTGKPTVIIFDVDYISFNPTRPPEVGGQSAKLSAEQIKKSQSEIPGTSEAENFSLDNPTTEWSKPLPEQVTPKNADLFAEPKSNPLRMDGTPRPERQKAEALPGFDSLPQATKDKFNTAFESKDIPKMQEYLDQANKNLRAEFENRTGAKLPNTVKGTDQAVSDYFADASKKVEAEQVRTWEQVFGGHYNQKEFSDAVPGTAQDKKNAWESFEEYSQGEFEKGYPVSEHFEAWEKTSESKKYAEPEANEYLNKETIPYSRDLKITNLDALPKGVGARYLLAIKGDDGAFVAKQWRRTVPHPMNKIETLIDFEAKPEGKQPHTWFELGRIANQEYSNADSTTSSTSLKPKPEYLKKVSDKLGITEADVKTALYVFNSADPRSEEKTVTKPVPTIGKAEPEAKEPWQMTKEEYVSQKLKINAYKKDGDKWIGYDSQGNEYDATAEITSDKYGTGKEFRNAHKFFVTEALDKGLPVPENVLADYPDLQPKGEGTPDHPITQQLLSIKEKLSTITSKDEAAAIDKSVSREIYDEIKRYDSSLAYNLMKKAEVGLPAALSLNKGVKTGKDSLYQMQVKELNEVLVRAIDLLREENAPVSGRMNEATDQTTTADSGEELKYNKRNRIKTGIKWEDIADKNTALKVKETNKQNVYPKPDYAQMVDDGMEPMIAHIVKQVYDSIPVSPATSKTLTDELMQRYITAVNRVMDGAIQWANDKDAIAAWAGKQARYAGAALGKMTNLTDLAQSNKSLLDIVYPDGYKAHIDEVRILGGNNVLKALQPGYDQGKKAMKEIKKGWPGKLESWQKQGYAIVERKDVKVAGYTDSKDKPIFIGEINGRTFGERYGTKGDAQAAVDGMKPFIMTDKYSRPVSQHDSLEEAQEAARGQVKRENKPKINEKGISVQRAQRTGAPRREPGENITTDKLRETFGFKGVNFGNWMKGNSNEAERQLHLNHAYDSFMDLAEILNVPPKAISLNGFLGVAFGAQGSGAHAAHFVPGVNEINLTRTAGAGAMTHEWGHALDHYFANQAGRGSAQHPYLTENKPQGGTIRPEIVELFKNIVQSMNKKTINITPEEQAQQLAARKEDSQKRINSWLRNIKEDFIRNKVTEEDFDKLADRIRNLDLGEGKIAVSGGFSMSPVVAELRNLYKEKAGRVYSLDQIKGLQSNIDHYKYITEKENEEHIPQTRETYTDYSKESAKADKGKSKPYWDTEREKFARAFDAFVTDAIEEKDATNTYPSGLEAIPPKGEERVTINKAFRDLIEEIKTRETDKGVEMYSAEEKRNATMPTLPEVQKVFKGQEVTEVDGGFSIKTRGGKDVIVKIVDHISPNRIAMKIGYGQNALQNGKVVAGKYHNDTIYLAKGVAGKWTLAHESIHLIEAMGLMTPNEVNLLKTHIKNLVRDGKFKTENKEDVGGAEDRANFLADAMTKEPKGLLGRIVSTIQEFIDKLVNAFGIRTVRGITRDIKTGKVYGKIDNIQEKAYNYPESDGGYGKVSDTDGGTLWDNPRRDAGVPYQPTITGIEKIGNVKTYIRKITTAYDAAQVAAQYLKKYPDEHFISLVLGKQGKLLHVYRHAIGLRGSSQASISGIIGEAINTPGAESIIVAHNHPSQQARFSPEDIKFTRELQNLAAGSGISVRDSLAVTMSSYTSYEQSGGLGSSPVGDSPGSINIPLVERVFKSIHNGEKISAPDQAIEAARKHIPNGGTLLLDGNNAVAGSIPVSDYRKIRGAAQAELLRELEKRNARAIIAYSPNRPVGINEAANIKTFANATGGEIKVLDIIDQQGSMADSGKIPSPNGNEFYSVQREPLNDHWNTLEHTKWDNILYNIADKNIDAKDVVSTIKRFTKKEISESEDIKLKETAYSGRLDARVKEFMETEFRPVMESLARAGVSRETFEEYLLMRHAKEANDYYRRNKGTPDGGSGVFDADVDAYFRTLDDAANRKMAPIAEKIDAITHKSAETLIEYGVESRNTIGAWFGSYEHYVPLSRDDDPVTGRIRQTGFSISGSSSARRQEGSDKPALNILANIAAQREKYIKRGEKNIIAKALYALAKENPNPEFWEVAKPQVVPKANVVTGELVPILDESYKKEDMVIMSRQLGMDGEIIERGIRFNEKNARAARMALALKNLDLDSIGAVLGTMAKVTRYMASINTQYNPVFGITNFFRDLGTMAFNLSTTPIAGKQALVLKGVGPAMMGISKALRGDFTSEQSKLFKEFQMHGGQTGYVDLYKTAEDRTDAIDKQLKLIEGKNPIRGLISWAGDALSNYNTSIENAVRLSAYEVGLANGMSKDKAAAMAKDLTVNFNRKGQWASQAGAMYAFFNASVQGTARMYETFKGPAGKKIIMGGILFGSAQALVLAAAGFGDDEPPDFVRERNIIIPIGGKKYVTIPMPLGFNVLPNIGRIPVEIALTGGKGADKKIASMLGVILETFNPMGSSGISLQTIMPTIADPFVALAENKDWTGKTIYRENYNSLDPAPGPSRAKNTSTMLGRALSSALNLATGGSKYTPGYFSPTPDQIDYLIGQATGGIGREAGKISQTVQSLASGEELPAHKIPVAGRFYGNAEGSTHEGTQFYDNIKKLNAHEREIKGRVKDGKPVSEYIKDNPEARFYKMANAIDGNVKKLKQRKEMLKQRNASKDYILSIDNQITAQMKRLNTAVDRTTNL